MSAPASSPSLSPLLELADVTRTFPGPPPVTAVSGASLTIRPAELVAVVGPSGSGKSTVLNIMGLLDDPTTGVRRLFDTDTAERSERELVHLRATRLGFVFQAFHLVTHLNVAQNVMLPLVHQGWPARRRRPRAMAALEQVRMDHLATAFPATLSGGEKQRVAVARAVVHEPDLILCDEPTGNLDTASTALVLDHLRRLVTDRRAVVVVTHDPEVRARADRIIPVEDGRVG
jgi:putative ABC transport system ATP-binding protein